MNAFLVENRKSKSDQNQALVYAQDSDEARYCAVMSLGGDITDLVVSAYPSMDRYARPGSTHAYREYDPQTLYLAGLTHSPDQNNELTLPRTLSESHQALIESRFSERMAWQTLKDLGEYLGLDFDSAAYEYETPFEAFVECIEKQKSLSY